MNPDYVMLRFGELSLKGRNRHIFENQVIQHIKEKLTHLPRLEWHKTFGRLYIELNGATYEPIAEKLRKTFGLQSFSPIYEAETSLENIQRKALEVMRQIEPSPTTFKVNCRRADKRFMHTSQDLNRLIGSHLLTHIEGLQVDVHDPEVELYVEVRAEGTFIYDKKEFGLGGLPVGTSDRAMLMLSGGIDSPVAGWLSMKRGVEIEGVHFHSYPYTSERAQQKVIDLTKMLRSEERRVVKEGR